MFSLVYFSVEVCLVGLFSHSVNTRRDPCVRVYYPSRWGWGCVFSVFPFPFWWLREYNYFVLSSSSNRKYELLPIVWGKVMKQWCALYLFLYSYGSKFYLDELMHTIWMIIFAANFINPSATGQNGGQTTDDTCNFVSEYWQVSMIWLTEAPFLECDWWDINMGLNQATNLYLNQWWPYVQHFYDWSNCTCIQLCKIYCKN